MFEGLKFRKRLYKEIEMVSLVMDEEEHGSDRWEQLNCIRDQKIEYLAKLDMKQLDPNKVMEVGVKGAITVGALAWEERNVWTSRVFKPFGI